MNISEIDLWVSIEQILTSDEFWIFEMRYRGHMAQKHIAEETGLSQSAISNRLMRIKEKIGRLL